MRKGHGLGKATQLFQSSGAINTQVLGKSINQQELRLKEEDPRRGVGVRGWGRNMGSAGSWDSARVLCVLRLLRADCPSVSARCLPAPS